MLLPAKPQFAPVLLLAIPEPLPPQIEHFATLPPSPHRPPRTQSAATSPCRCHAPCHRARTHTQTHRHRHRHRHKHRHTKAHRRTRGCKHARGHTKYYYYKHLFADATSAASATASASTWLEAPAPTSGMSLAKRLLNTDAPSLFLSELVGTVAVLSACGAPGVGGGREERGGGAGPAPPL